MKARREGRHPRKRFRLRRASAPAVLGIVLLACLYGFGIYALTGNAGAAPRNGVSSAPPSEPITTEQITTEKTKSKASCTKPDGCRPPADVAPDGVFLCYSKFQVVPGVWPQDAAADLHEAGYWYPFAVPGNVEGGPNLGAYHLECNPIGSTTGEVVNENGEVFPASYATPDTIGYYPLVA
jgi:hypothetical protein